MFNTLKQLFGFGPKVDYTQLIKEGAIILDVRTKGEFQQGHIKGAKNVPLNNLSKEFSKLSTSKTIITCCASGVRSAQAKKLLSNNGYTAVNGGGWSSLQRKI